MTETHPPYRLTTDTCPHCGRDLSGVIVRCDGYGFPVRGACPEHGDVPLMRRVVVNRYPDTGPVWDGEGP